MLCNTKRLTSSGSKYIQRLGGRSMTLDKSKKPQLSNETGALSDVETVITGFTDVYGRMLGKRFDQRFFEKSVLTDGTHGCNYLLTCDMEMTPQDGFAYSNWSSGYGDFHLVPDLSTWRKLSWLDSTGIVLCDVLDPKTHQLASVAPRSILKKQAAVADEAGYSVNAASELEYYMFDNSYRQARAQKYNDLTPAGDYFEDYHIQQGTRNEWVNAQFRRHLRDSGIPVECTKGEAGMGQHELNIEYSKIVDMADRHVLYKQCLREVAELNGVSVTFMPKPFTDSTGSGCHIHLSLQDKQTGKFLFAGNENIGRLEGCSETFKHFLAGWIAHAPELFPFYAPTINSYKRYVAGSWAPTKCAWSFDNRSAGFRVVGSGDSLRIEMRMCGADVNPYLAFAASLAAGMDGIKNKMEPPMPFDGDIYSAKDLQEVPTTFDSSIRALRDSEFAKKAFGSDVIEHYCHFYELEKHNYEKAVTDWERHRYFEMI